MANRNVLAIGTSAGGVEALRFLASEFPRDFPASVLAVIHLSAQYQSSLDSILTQAGPLPARFAKDDMTVEPAQIYIGPPDSHLILEGDKLRLGQGPRENNTRPAIDPLFRSVAQCAGSAALGVIMTGMGGDGAAGLLEMKKAGAVTLAQDEASCVVYGMPKEAVKRGAVDRIVPLGAIAGEIQKRLG